jgi:acetyl esterase
VPLDPATREILDQMAAAGAPDFSDLSPVAFRLLFSASLGALDSAAATTTASEGTADDTRTDDTDTVDVEDRTIDGPGGPLRLRVYRPAGARPRREGPAPLVVFFHGGGWVIGDIDTHDGTCRILCRSTGAVVVSVDYRLAPEHPFPAAVDDCIAATSWVADHGADLGGDPGRLGLAGDSAGGNLAAVVAQHAQREGSPAIRAQALVYPAVDFTEIRPSFVANGEGYLLTADSIRWFSAQYLADHDPADPRASPLLGDLAGLPPAVVAVAEFDPLHDEGLAYAAALSDAGVSVRTLDFGGLVHGFMGLGALSPASARARDEVWKAFAALLDA